MLTETKMIQCDHKALFVTFVNKPMENKITKNSLNLWQRIILRKVIVVGFVRESVILMTSRLNEFSLSVRRAFLVARRIVANENYCLFFPDKDREKYAILDCDGEK